MNAMTLAQPAPWIFDLCGGHVALDFANTMSDRPSSSPIDRLADYADLVGFAVQTGILTKTEARAHMRRAASDPAAAERTLGEARALREALYAVFSAQAADRSPTPRDVEVIDAAWHRLSLDSDFHWTWNDGSEALDSMLGPIVESAVALLTAGPRDRVRTCESDTCQWVFLDTSKNRSRRWCDMKQCGNREKARRFQERARAR
jgi:predicted RNA-binding Zn ribbon-like protein